MTAFAADLRRALTRRGMTPTAAARAAGLNPETVLDLHKGRTVPTTEVAEALADALSWSSLPAHAIADRTGTCPVCGGSFVWNPKGRRRKHCDRCTQVVRGRRQRERDRQNALTDTRIVRKRLADHQAAVAAMCLGCEPEGLCRDAACPLRPVSVLPLARTRAA